MKLKDLWGLPILLSIGIGLASGCGSSDKGGQSGNQGTGATGTDGGFDSGAGGSSGGGAGGSAAGTAGTAGTGGGTGVSCATSGDCRTPCLTATRRAAVACNA